MGEAVFAFKDGRAATFDTFTVLIPGAADLKLADFELLVGDVPNGPFTSLGTFRTQNTRIMKQPYQEFRFAPTRAKFLKVRHFQRFGDSREPPCDSDGGIVTKRPGFAR